MKVYLNKQDIRRMLNVKQSYANKVYDLASKIDDEELGDYRIEQRKIRSTSMLKVIGFSLDDLARLGALE